VDFRNLVHDLAQILHTRVEMRQVGVRDQAKFLGGYGRCGRPLCCASWLREFAPVSIKMAKTQDLPLNASEVSGVCGRLLCCLSYENDFYAEARQRMPKLNTIIDTPEGPGKVKQFNVLRNSVTALVEGPGDSTSYVEVVLPEQAFPEGAPAGPCADCPQGRGVSATADDETVSFREDDAPVEEPRQRSAPPAGRQQPKSPQTGQGGRPRSRRRRH
jgi:hypothetical protein